MVKLSYFAKFLETYQGPFEEGLFKWAALDL